MQHNRYRCLCWLSVVGLAVFAYVMILGGGERLSARGALREAVQSGDARLIHGELQALPSSGLRGCSALRRDLSKWLWDWDGPAVSKRVILREVVRLDALCVDDASLWSRVGELDRRVLPHVAVAFARAFDEGRVAVSVDWESALSPIWASGRGAPHGDQVSVALLAVVVGGRWGAAEVLGSLAANVSSQMWLQLAWGAVRGKWVPGGIWQANEPSRDLLRLWCGEAVPNGARRRIHAALLQLGFEVIEPIEDVWSGGLESIDRFVRRNRRALDVVTMDLDILAMGDEERVAYVLAAILLNAASDAVPEELSERRRVGGHVMGLYGAWIDMAFREMIWSW